MLLSLDNVYPHLVLIGHVDNVFIFPYLIFLRRLITLAKMGPFNRIVTPCRDLIWSPFFGLVLVWLYVGILVVRRLDLKCVGLIVWRSIRPRSWRSRRRGQRGCRQLMGILQS